MTFTAEIFKKIGEIINDNPRISNYTITGYKWLDTRLVLHFVDCNQVFDFSTAGDELVVTSFFTNDQEHEEYMKVLDIFKTNNTRDIPEQK